MSDTESNARPGQNACPYSAAAEFERAVNEAQDLLEKSDLEGALRILQILEARYVSCTKLFDLLGDVFLRKGDVEEGVRYKTLHEVLKGTFKIVSRHAEQSSLPQKPVVTHEKLAASLKAVAPEPEFPVTAAMAQEFLRQGHYDRAVEVFVKLVEMHPEDRLLREAEEKARKKLAEKELMGTLQRWLNNIERMKLNKSGGI